MVEITPHEFLRDGYTVKVRDEECIVWYRDSPIEWVVKRQNYYELHCDDGGDYSRIANVGEFSLCLQVEAVVDRVHFRERLKGLGMAIVDQTDDDELIALMIEYRRMLSWCEENAKNATQSED